MKNKINSKKIKKKALAMMCIAALTVPTIPVFADSTKVVSLGKDLTNEQKKTMLKYFNIKTDPSVQKIYVTNKDEIKHLSDYIPREQIGTRTVSCAYIKPTESGGIRVKTANLQYVTANMIASTLADLGIKNCEVVAACPFAVSGTGALTGIIMAYETATGEELDKEKKEIATQEMVIIKDLAQSIGTDKAETIINQSKAEAVQNNISDKQEIQNTITNIINQNNVNITNEQVQNITNLTQNIVNQDYDDDYVETITGIEETQTPEDDTLQEIEDEYSITSGLDESVLGEDVVVSATLEDDLVPVEEEVIDEEFLVDDSTLEAIEDDVMVTGDEANKVPDVSKFGFNMKDVIEKSGEDKAREFISIEEYMIEHFPAKWTEKELMARNIKPECKMSVVSETIMNSYYEYLIEDEHNSTLFDTFMSAVSKLMEENVISEAEGESLHEIAPLEKLDELEETEDTIEIADQ